MGRLAKLTDLFEEGMVAPLKASDGSEVIVWINKLSPFENEQANHEGRVARARIMLAIKEFGTPESDLFRLASEGASVETIINALLAAKENERSVKVIRDIRADRKWKEKIETLEWSTEQLVGRADDDPEVKTLTKILTDYQAEISKRTDRLRNEARIELAALPEDKLREAHRESYRDQEGLTAFIREQSATQVYYAMRVCEATRDADGRWQHSSCDHSQRWLESRLEVNQLPELLLTQVQRVYDELNMSPEVARFLGGPASSSESRGPSSKPEESKESGPVETSDEPVGISSSQ
jgi:hypothetical protein